MRAVLLCLIVVLISCNHQKAPEENKAMSMVGTWELIATTTIQGDSTTHDDLTGKRMIKIINDSHFAFLNHDVNNENDSLKVFVARGGKYQLTGNQYVEFLEYCNYREWEGNKFEFTVEMRGDTLIQTGIEKVEGLGVDRKIEEVYLKSKD